MTCDAAQRSATTSAEPAGTHRRNLLRRALAALLVILLSSGTAVPAEAGGQLITVGAKAFTEQEILGELVAAIIEHATGVPVRRRLGLGGTDLCHAALVRGEIDLYVEYTGTALVNVLGLPPDARSDRVFRVVAAAYRDRFDVEWLPPIGFDNTYAIAVRRETAEALELTLVSDLAAHAHTLRGGFPAEFAERPDGLSALAGAIGSDFAATVDLDPGIMYDALRRGEVDVIAAFATDPRIDPDEMVLLADDAGLFPPYFAAPIIRADLLQRMPHLRDALAALAGTIDDDAMRRLNAMVDLEGRRPAEVAAQWLRERGIVSPDAHGRADSAEARPYPGDSPVARDGGFFALAVERRTQVLRLTGEHLFLCATALGIAVLLGVPLGILADRCAVLRGPVLGLTEIVQTVPSLAMLAFLFALFGTLGFWPAVAALVLYALLPVVVNTLAGLRAVPASVRLAADALGMSRMQRLVRVELPLAAPILLSGVRTSAILCVGVATLSTYIGAGGLGDLIARGLARNDPRLTLLGAIPAALLALAAGLLIRTAEWWADPMRGGR